MSISSDFLYDFALMSYRLCCMATSPRRWGGVQLALLPGGYGKLSVSRKRRLAPHVACSNGSQLCLLVLFDLVRPLFGKSVCSARASAPPLPGRTVQAPLPPTSNPSRVKLSNFECCISTRMTDDGFRTHGRPQNVLQRGRGRVKKTFLKAQPSGVFLGFIGFFGQTGKIGKIIQKLSNLKP